MTSATVTTRHIPIELIDEPARPMRETFGEDELNELTASIRAIGLIEPVIVKARGTRYEVVAGHRRLIACRRAGLGDVRCEIRELTDEATEAIKHAENTDREDVNVIEEATYFASLYADMCGEDVDRVCDVVKRSRRYVEERLLLLRGDETVTAALREKKISMAVAQELNKFADRKGTAMYLEYALNGATARQVRDWRRQYDDFLSRNPDAPTAPSGDASTMSAAPALPTIRCECCRAQENLNRLISIQVHDYCFEAVVKKMLRAYHGEA